MPGIIGQGQTFNLPNYVGELFHTSPRETPFLTLIGGLSGGKAAVGTVHTWQEDDLRDADKHRQRLEGADAPPAEERARGNVRNVLEIHQEAVDVSYTKQAAVGQFASTGSLHPNAVGLAGMNPVIDESAYQIDAQLAQMGRDIEKGFVGGLFQEPATNATPRKTRGMLEATVTNVSDQGTIVGDGASTIDAAGLVTEVGHGLVVGDVVVPRAITSDAIGVIDDEHLYYVTTVPLTSTFTISASLGGSTITFPGAAGTADFYTTSVLTKTTLDELMQDVWDAGGLNDAESAGLMVNSPLKRALTKIYITDANYQETSRTVGGLSLQTINTDFGQLNVILNRYEPSGALQVVTLSQCSPVFLPIPDKGFLFVEPLDKTGASTKHQLYGEIGLEYGNERAHGKVLAVRAA